MANEVWALKWLKITFFHLPGALFLPGPSKMDQHELFQPSWGPFAAWALKWSKFSTFVGPFSCLGPEMVQNFAFSLGDSLKRRKRRFYIFSFFREFAAKRKHFWGSGSSQDCFKFTMELVFPTFFAFLNQSLWQGMLVALAMELVFSAFCVLKQIRAVLPVSTEKQKSPKTSEKQAPS